MSKDYIGELNSDILKSTEIMELLGITPDELDIPSRFKKLNDILDFIKNYSNYRYIINSITIGKNVDKLEHTWNYFNIVKEKISKEKELLMLDITDETDENKMKCEILENEILQLTKEMEFFEK